MRTTLNLDKKLLDEAMKWTGESTKTSVINEALKEIIKNRKRLGLVEMAGKVKLAVCCASAQNRIKIHDSEFLYRSNCISSPDNRGC
jgi:Arc/MetJ family transcription regulator